MLFEMDTTFFKLADHCVTMLCKASPTCGSIRAAAVRGQIVAAKTDCVLAQVESK
jgi:hypothetical protein